MTQAKVDLNVQDYIKRTPLIIATKYDYPDIAKLLIEAGADVNLQDKYGDTALLIATQRGNKVIVKLLLDKPSNE